MNEFKKLMISKNFPNFRISNILKNLKILIISIHQTFINNFNFTRNENMFIILEL